MSANQDEILGRLQKTIENWTGEVTSAHSTLTHQIGEASEELHTLVRVIAARNQNGSALTTAVEELGALKKIIAEREQALGDITEYNSGLELEIKKLQDTVNELTARDEQQSEAPPVDTGGAEEIAELRETVLMLEGELETLRVQATGAASPDASTEAEVATLRETVATLEVELEALRNQAAEMALPDVSTEAEVATLRETISALEANIETLEAEAVEVADTSAAESASADPDTIAALENALETLRTQLDDAKQETETARGELSATRIEVQDKTLGLQVKEDALRDLRTQLDNAKSETEALRDELSATQVELQDKKLGIQVKADEAETLREHEKQAAEVEKEFKREITELRVQLQESATALEEERARTAKEHDVATEDSAHYIEVLEENAALKQQLDEKESEIKASQDQLAQLREEFDQATEAQEAAAAALRETGDAGEEQLMKTLAELDSLRLEADEQSSELEDRLEASNTELERKALGMQSSTDASEELQERLVKTSETEIELREELESVLEERDKQGTVISGLEERLEQALEELLKLQDQATDSTDSVQSLTGQLATLRTEVEKSAADQQRAQDELASLREASAEASESDQKRSEEIEALHKAVTEKEATLQEAQSAADRVQSISAELDTVRAEAETSAADLQRARDELESLRKAAAAQASEADQKRSEEIEALHNVLTEKEATLQEAQEELKSLQEEATRSSSEERKHSEKIESLRKTVREKDSALQEADDTISSLQADIDSRPVVAEAEIEALDKRVRELTEGLDSANMELQVKTKLLEESQANEERRAAELGVDEGVQDVDSVELIEAQARIEVLEGKLETRAREKDALSHELASTQARHEEQIKEMQREFEWFREAEGIDLGSAPQSGPEAPQLGEKAARVDHLERETAELRNPITELEAEIAQWKSTGDSEGVVAKRNAKSRDSDLDPDAAGQDAPKAPETAKVEMDGLRVKVSERDKMTEEQQKRILYQDEALEKIQNDLQTIMIQAQTPGGVGEDDLTALLDDVRKQNESLQDALAQRDLELDRIQDGERTPEQILAEQGRRIAQAAYDENGARRPMGQILVNAGVITKQQLDSALEQQKSATHRRLGGILVENGFIRDENIAHVLASQLRLPFVQLNQEEIQPRAIRLLTGKLATHHMCIPIRVANGEITIAMSNPLDLIAIEDLELSTDLVLAPVVATLADITSAIVRYYGVDTSAFDHEQP